MKQNNEHTHDMIPVILYFIGLTTFIIAIFLKDAQIKNIFFTISVVTAGYHVMGDGFISTYNESKSRKKFHPNVHLLMGLAAVGAMIIGDFQEGALLIIIFAGAHFLEDYA
ncbi:MAG TPA: heavy metal translocating P-type ATPase, partial [Erysipelothrix sp.]|nr:heavy metal translocating P-type ATPase [Erysipelothrix sp.]